MKNHELLVPVGDMNCLYQAVHNGADAVYLGGKSFGARKFAKNFSNDEMISAIHYCHLYGVRIYVTMNTLIKNSEVDPFLEQVRFLHKNGIDALIVQDFGMICLLREKFPNLEIHASTQANICSLEVCKLYHNIGVKRVVFAREFTIDEIDSIDVDIEKEAFIHGALCISYSGCCLMSSMLGGRSGNRGECAGVCRMPFSLYKGKKNIESNKYLLSTKELNTTSKIKRLLDSSIYSFKIEGRMKSPLYVGFITRLYRRLIDGEDFDLEVELEKLKTIFNREFTVGRMFRANDLELMNTNSPNHIGLEIGKVIDINKDKITIKLNRNLHQGDAIRFSSSNKGFIVNYLYDEKGKLISNSSNICMVDNKVNLDSKDVVLKTQDYLLNKEFESIIYKKIPITFKVMAKVGKALNIEISDGENVISEKENIVLKAINSPITKESIIKHLGKLGSTPFTSIKIDIDMDDNIFIPVKSINEMRRKLIEKLIVARENTKNDFIERDITFIKNNNICSVGEIHCSVFNEEQLKTCLELNIDRIYVPRYLYNKYKNIDNVYLKVERCLNNVSKKLEERNLLSETISCNNDIGNYTLNVFNIYTAYYLQKYGFKEICLSVELSKKEIDDFISLYLEKFGNFTSEVLVYGRVENMIIKGNILNIEKNNLEYYLEDLQGRDFLVYYDGRITHILNYKCQNLDFFVNNIRLDFYTESSLEIKNIVKKYQLIKRNY